MPPSGRTNHVCQAGEDAVDWGRISGLKLSSKNVKARNKQNRHLDTSRRADMIQLRSLIASAAHEARVSAVIRSTGNHLPFSVKSL